GEPPSSYNIHVKPYNLTDNFCNKSLDYYKHINDKEAMNASVPEFLDVVHDLRIIPGCSYKIVVESNPHNGKKNASLYYTVPESKIVGNNVSTIYTVFIQKTVLNRKVTMYDQGCVGIVINLK
ncbi:hypothetical protein L9F63_003050, partial [Diploptera punctata]